MKPLAAKVSTSNGLLNGIVDDVLTRAIVSAPNSSLAELSGNYFRQRRSATWRVFRWTTLKEIGPDDLQQGGMPVPGIICEVELMSGKTVRVWRSEDGQQYFCHGLTFGGKESPEGAISPYTGSAVETILQEYYQMISEGQARAGDILVWRGIAPASTPHSAILIDAVMVQEGGWLDEATMLQTKNGLTPETTMTLGTLIEKFYGETYRVYRRK